MTATRSPVQIVRDCYAALLERGDLEAFLKVCDARSVMMEATSLPYGGTYTGRDAIRTGIQKVFAYWKDFAFAVEDIVGNDKMAIAYGTFSATSIKTGRKVSMPLTEVWKFEGETARLLMPIYSDTKAAVDALT